MNDKTPKPEKKGIARPTRKATKDTKNTNTGRRASSRKNSKVQVPDPIVEEVENDKQPENGEGGDEQQNVDEAEEQPPHKTKPKNTKTKAAQKPSSKMPRISEDEGEPEDEPPKKTKSKPASKSSATTSAVSGDEGDQYFDRAYVDAHIDSEDFHHRGAGRWVRGLPGPDAHSRTAVAGPGAEAWKAAVMKDGRK